MRDGVRDHVLSRHFVTATCTTPRTVISLVFFHRGTTTPFRSIHPPCCHTIISAKGMFV